MAAAIVKERGNWHPTAAVLPRCKPLDYPSGTSPEENRPKQYGPFVSRHTFIWKVPVYVMGAAAPPKIKPSRYKEGPRIEVATTRPLHGWSYVQVRFVPACGEWFAFFHNQRTDTRVPYRRSAQADRWLIPHFGYDHLQEGKIVVEPTDDGLLPDVW